METKQIQQITQSPYSHVEDFGTLHFILGGMDVGFYIGFCLFAFLGFIIEKLLAFHNRKHKKTFDIHYFISDNVYDIILGFLMTLALARFHSEIFKLFPEEYTKDFNIMFIAFAYGFFHTVFFQIVRRWSSFGKYLKSKNHIPDDE